MGDDGRENLPRRRSNETRSRRSIKETKSIPYLMGDEARENRREARRRTESRSMEETTKEKNESDHKERKLDREKSEHKTIVDERSRRRGYPVLRPRERACRSYRHTGLCIYGSNCLFNHPRCKFFPRGACKEGSACKFLHEKDTDVPMRQANSSKDRDGEEPIRQSSRRHETESDYWKEENETRDWVFNIEKKYNRSLSQICDGIVAGYKREKMEKVQRHGQGGLQEQRQRENTERQRTEPQEHRQRDTTEWEKREAQENGHEHRKRDTTKWQRYFENKRREAQENPHDQRLMEIPENHKVDAHGQEDNLKVDRKRESIEWQTREAQEMERRKSKASLEEQRVKAKLDKKRKRDVEKLEVEADKSSEEQRLKENATLDSQVNKRCEEIRSQVIDETVDDVFNRARMAKAIQDSKGVERFKDISQIHDEIVAGYIRAVVNKFEESVEDQRLKDKPSHDQPNMEGG